MLLVTACKSRPEAPENFPEGFPLPEAGHRVTVDTSALSEDQAWVFEYPSSSPTELADELREALDSAGWSVTWEDVSEGRHLVQVEREAVRVEVAVLAGTSTTLTVRIMPELTAEALNDGGPPDGMAPAPTPTAPEAEPTPSQPSPVTPPTPPMAVAPADYPAGFPFLPGGVRDPGYPPEPAGYPEFLFVFSGMTVEQASQRLRAEATQMGWTCTDYDPSSVACTQGSRLISLNLDQLPSAFPIPGDIGVFVAELPNAAP